ncbi:AMP-binding protein [Virgibacillus ainsalahensis]
MKITGTYHQHAQRHPDHAAIVTDEQTITYQEWVKIVHKTASAFSQETAVHRRVAIFLPNEHVFLQVFAGASEAGWASIVGDMRWKQQEMEERLKQTEPDLIIADERLKDSFQNQTAKIIFSTEIRNWIGNSQQQCRTVDGGQIPFYIGFTSGSTGEPKAFIRSHQSWVETFQCNQVDLGMTGADHVLIPGSFVNSTFLYGALSTLYLGGTIYVLKKFSPARLMNILQHNPISAVYVVPTMIQALMEEGWQGKQQISFISTGAKWLPSVKQAMRIQFPHAAFYEFYGTSELSYITVLKDEEQTNYGDSVGRAFHNVEISIRNEEEMEVDTGEAGVLYVRSNMLFDGYINNKEETEKAFAGEWATAQDIAKRDEEGFVYILGRKNDMILYGGTNIYPQEIERVLKDMDGVEEAVVFGVKDAYWGEKVAACIKGDVTIRALKAYCRQCLSAYKIPRIWRRIDCVPHTSGGKVSRQELRKYVETGVLK